jgi:hypothetical protein
MDNGLKGIFRILLVLVCLLGVGLEPAWAKLAEGISEPIKNENISIPGYPSASFNDWYTLDYHRLATRLNQYQREPALAVRLVAAEWAEINQQLQSRLTTPDYQDPQRGYLIYDAVSSGQLHVLGLARTARENFLRAAMDGQLKGEKVADLYPALDRIYYHPGNAAGFSEMVAAQPDQYVTVVETRQALDQIKLPDQVFQNYRVFLLPYRLKEARGFSYSAGLPLQEERTFISARGEDSADDYETAATLVHEFGHYLHQQFIGNYAANPAVWTDYLKIRGRDSFVETGEWSELTEENFAEDFKMLYGQGLVLKEGHRGCFGDPRQLDSLASQLRHFISNVAERQSAKPLELEQLLLAEPGDAAASEHRILATELGINFLDTLVLSEPNLMVRGRLSSPPSNGSQFGIWLTGPGIGESNPQPITLVSDGTGMIFNQTSRLPQKGRYFLMLGELNASKHRFVVYYHLELLYPT